MSQINYSEDEIQRLLRIERSWLEFMEKTEWVQKGLDDGTVSPRHLGRHRADVARSIIEELKRDNERWQQNYQHLMVQHMPRTGHGCEEGWSRVVEARELQAENTELKAALVGLFDEYKAGADSGDWGHWRVEETEAGQVALKSINRLIRQEQQP